MGKREATQQLKEIYCGWKKNFGKERAQGELGSSSSLKVFIALDFRAEMLRGLTGIESGMKEYVSSDSSVLGTDSKCKSTSMVATSCMKRYWRVYIRKSYPFMTSLSRFDRTHLHQKSKRANNDWFSHFVVLLSVELSWGFVRGWEADLASEKQFVSPGHIWFTKSCLAGWNSGCLIQRGIVWWSNLTE